jgi:ketosteroid isomerase-like protein
MKTATQKTESLEALTRKGTCIEFFSAYQDMDIDRMLALCSPDGEIFVKPLGNSGKGKIHQKGKDLWTALMDAFPGLDNTVQNQIFSEQNNTVTCDVVILGQQEKPFAGIPSQGLRFESEHIFIFHFDDESKIDQIEVDWDHNRFVNQLTGVS